MSQSLPLPQSDRQVSHTASAGQTAFSYDFPILAGNELLVQTRPDADTAWTTLAETTQYAVSGIGEVSGGYVTLVTGLAAGIEIRITGLAPVTSTADVTPAGQINSKGINRFFDRTTIWVQEIRRDATEALTEVLNALPLLNQMAANLATTITNRLLGEAARDLAQQYAADAAQVSGVNVPIYASVASASGTAGPAGVKTIRTQFHSPVYAMPGTLRGGAEYIRVSKAVIDAAGYPALAYFRRTDRFMPDGTEDATNGGYWLINERRLDPTMFGARLDGTTDDTAAAQACALMCCLTGREFCFPRGYLRLTEPLKFGRDVYTSLAWLKSASNGRPDTVAAAAVYSATNLAYNDANYFPPALFVESGSAVIADFTATNADPKAVIYYNFRATGVFFAAALYGAPLIIGTPINIATGKFNSDADFSVIPDNGLIGIWFCSTQRSIIGTVSPHKMGFAGVASWISYQTDFQNIFAYHCGDGALIWEHNSSKVSVTANYCNRGLAIYGDAIEGSLGTQQCRQDMIYFSGDNLVMKLRYIEDYSPAATDGSGASVVQLGISGGGAGQVRNPTFIGGRFGTVRSSKKSMIGYGASNITVIDTRFYNKVPEFDTNCTGIFINTDLTQTQYPPRGYFSVISQGSARFSSSHGLGGVVYEGAFRVSSTGLSISLPAGAGISSSPVTRTITLPAGTIPASAGPFDYQNAIGQVDLAAGYNGVYARVIGFNSATQVITLQFWNFRASPVTIDQAFHVYFKLTSTGFLSIDP